MLSWVMSRGEQSAPKLLLFNCWNQAVQVKNARFNHYSIVDIFEKFDIYYDSAVVIFHYYQPPVQNITFCLSADKQLNRFP